MGQDRGRFGQENYLSYSILNKRRQDQQSELHKTMHQFVVLITADFEDIMDDITPKLNLKSNETQVLVLLMLSRNLSRPEHQLF